MVWPARPEAEVMVCPASKAHSTAERKLPLSLVLVTMMGPQPCGADRQSGRRGAAPA
jgi:hypothetical protein